MSTHRLAELSLLVVICLIHCYTNSCHGQLTSPGQAQGQCEYRFQVSSPVDCSRTDPALEQAIDLIKQDIDRSRLTFVGQNSAVQKQIADLKTTLDRVDTDVDTVKTQLAFGQSGDLVHKDEFKQLQKEVHGLNLVVVNIRDNMDRQITFLQGSWAHQLFSNLRKSRTIQNRSRFTVPDQRSKTGDINIRAEGQAVRIFSNISSSPKYNIDHVKNIFCSYRYNNHNIEGRDEHELKASIQDDCAAHYNGIVKIWYNVILYSFSDEAVEESKPNALYEHRCSDLLLYNRSFMVWQNKVSSISK